MNKSNFEQELQQELAAIPKDKQPDRDLWAGIELAISQDHANTPTTGSVDDAKWYLVAATIALFGLLGWLSLGQQPVSLTGDELVASLSQQHQLQKNALLVRFQDQPALTQNWQAQVTELDEAAEAIKKALKNEPNNMALLKMLQNVYQQQIGLIERVHSPKWSQI